MDEALTFKKPSIISTEQAATVGVGLLVRCLAKIDLGVLTES